MSQIYRDYNCAWCDKVIRPDEQPDWKERMELCKSCTRDADYDPEAVGGRGVKESTSSNKSNQETKP